MFPDSPSTAAANRPANGFTDAVLEPAPDREFGTFALDYLRIWYPPMRFVRPTTTTGSTQDMFPGAVGNASTTALFGDGNVQAGQGQGVRITGTMWLIQPSVSVSADVWSTGTGIFQRTNGSLDGSKVVSRPFFNPASGQEEALPISLPGAFGGLATDTVRSRMIGADVLFRWTFNTGDRPLADGFYLSLVGGPKWMQLDESYSNHDFVQDLFFGTQSVFEDNFATRNSITGGVIGLDVTYVWDQLKFDFSAKAGAGVNDQTATINGSTQFVDPVSGATFVDPRLGTFAQPTNIGTYHRTQISYFGDCGLDITYDCTRYIRLKFGYDFMLISNVIRPSSQIDFNVNPQPLLAPVILPPAFPAPPRLPQETIPLHTLNIGFEVVF
jgi:putative beta barrel porin BBP7